MKYKCGNICGLALLTLLTGCPQSHFNEASTNPANPVASGSEVTITATCYTDEQKASSSFSYHLYSAVGCESQITISPPDGVISESCIEFEDWRVGPLECIPFIAEKGTNSIGSRTCGVYTFTVKVPESISVTQKYKLSCKAQSD